MHIGMFDSFKNVVIYEIPPETINEIEGRSKRDYATNFCNDLENLVPGHVNILTCVAW